MRWSFPFILFIGHFASALFFCGSLRLSFFWTAGGCRVFVDSKKGINRHTHSVRSKNSGRPPDLSTPTIRGGKSVCALDIIHPPSPCAYSVGSVGVGVFWAFVAHFGQSLRCASGTPPWHTLFCWLFQAAADRRRNFRDIFSCFCLQGRIFLSGRQLFLSGRHFSRFGDSCGLLKFYQADTCFYQADTFPFLVPD